MPVVREFDETTFGERLQLGTIASFTPKKSGKNKGSLPGECFCHYCIASCGIYAWRDQGKALPDKPFSSKPRGCGGYPEGCPICLPARACDDRQRVAFVKPQPQQDFATVHLQCLVHHCLFVDHAPMGAKKLMAESVLAACKLDGKTKIKVRFRTLVCARSSFA